MDADKPLEDVNITLTGDKTSSKTTDARGYYTFGALPAGGSYTITPVRAKTSFTLPSRHISNLTQDRSADFSAIVKRDLTEVCTDDEKDREFKKIKAEYFRVWQQSAEADRPKDSKETTPGGVIKVEWRLRPLDTKGKFKTCTSATIIVTYVWEVRPNNAGYMNLPIKVRPVEKTILFNYVKTKDTWRPE